MQTHHKIEMAARPNKCSAEFLKQCSDNYHKGGGKERQRLWIARMTPEQRERKAAASRAWKERNTVRMSLSRWASNCKERVRKKNPGVASISAWEFIGCNVVELQAYVEGMFREGIGWHNRNEWELDHIRPLCEFDLTDIEQVKQCLHYSNVQILITGPHLDKARQESRAFMDKLAREYWQGLRGGEYPGFAKAWHDFTKFRALRKAL
jgi:hypothetical protein